MGFGEISDINVKFYFWNPQEAVEEFVALATILGIN